MRIIILLFLCLTLTATVACNKEPEDGTNEPTATPVVYPTAEPYELQEGNAEEFKVSSVFGNNMIIQRDQVITIYGTAPESQNGKVVAASFKDLKGSGVIENGKWKVIMQGTLPASTEKGHMLTVNGATGTEKQFKDVLVGDVWYVGGQSNADLVFTAAATSLYSDVIKNASKDDPIRVFIQTNFDLSNYPDVVNKPQDNPIKIYAWKEVSRNVLYKTSMMGYFFAKKMTELNPNVPIGIVMIASGGATLSMLASEEALNEFPDQLKNKSMQLGKATISDASIYNAFAAPFIDFGIKGMLFYQGESDTATPDLYEQALKVFVEDLRDKFQENFLFLNVQLTSYGFKAGTIELNGIWDLINNMRNAQSNIKINNVIENYEVVTTYDVGWQKGDGDGAHPTYKKPIGDRLANIAASLVYNIGEMENVACPIPEKADFTKDSVVITFKYAGGGLKAKQGTELNGFEVQKDGKWESATAETDGNTVIIKVQNVTGVRYGYSLRMLEGTEATLVSGTDYPALSFEMLKK